MPKEVHQIYDTLKLMEQQEGTKKVEVKKKSKVILQIQIKQIIKR